MPVHCRSQLDFELDCLEKQGVISPIEHANNASPVVWVKKPTGRYRMCCDFKATLNSNIMSDAYPLPTIEEISSKIGNCSLFSKLDLKCAYWQIELDDESKELSVINTHKGLYRVNRMQMGMKNASAIFQRCIEHILKNMPYVIVYQDDVMICATSAPQMDRYLKAVESRLSDYNVTINLEKCVEKTESLKFLVMVFPKMV